ncbi:MAG: 2-oxoacid:acceptor oxidoreductase subunit alpha [Candidatus Hodarchaeales archaeon]|jgi:2-oxoglutarate ferredoxin oxidoreductase subunit alpha
MTQKELNVRAGGAAGDGIASMGEIISKIASRSGLEIFSYNSYQSVIRGGHSWYSIRLQEDKVKAPSDRIDVLLAVDKQTIDIHENLMNPGGVIIHREGTVCENLPEGVRSVPMPFLEIAKKFGTSRMQNTVALGAMCYFLQFPLSKLDNILADQFSRKSQEIVDQNITVAKAGYDFVKANNKPIEHDLKLSDNRKPIITGGIASSMGAIAGGLKFYSAYPMTPASPYLHYLAGVSEKTGVLVKQAEDELSVINMAIGAGVTGVRAACGTAGGGFALMTEAIGLASMVEAPLVVFEVMRGGPSTGLPTKTEQGDLNQLLGASQGDFPRVIMAFDTFEDSFYDTAEVLNIAEEFQLPVLCTSDFYFMEHLETVEPFDFSKVEIRRGESFIREWPADELYLRYKVTESGVSPRVLPGTPNTYYINGSDEHDEDSTLISDIRAGLPESLEIRKNQMEKRMRKMDEVLKKLPAPKLEGPSDAEITIVAWGSTRGVIEEAIEILNNDGIECNHLHIKYILPFHSKEVSHILHNTKHTIIVEANYTGQMARHIRAETGFEIKDKYLKYDGEPIYPREVANYVKSLVRRGE